MGGKRKPSEEERELFETALSDAQPLKGRPPRPRKCTPAKQHPPAAVAPEKRPAQAASRQPAGLDGNTADRLRRGLIEPQARLDLHGLTERTAHGALVTFLRSARSRNLRLVLVVTGKGLSPTSDRDESFDPGPDRHRRGILRSMTPRWLAEPALAESVADVREAHPRHGGAGALYVYLRKGKIA